MTRLSCVVLSVTILATFGTIQPAQAQAEAELQRCVWQCLANSPGAESEEYNQCVASNCAELAEAAAVPTTWQSRALTPDTSPYLDGRAASVLDSYEEVYLTYQCGRDGDSYLFLAGEPLVQEGLVNGANHSVRLSVDFKDETSLDFGEYEGTLAAQISPDHPLFGWLKAGNRVIADLPGWSAEFRLSGAEAALNDALSYCAGTAASTPDQASTDAQAPSPFRLTNAQEEKLRAAAATGKPAALNQLGVALLSGRLGDFDRTGYDLINQVAEAGYPPALVNRGYLATHFNTMMSKALPDTQRAAEAGDPIALTQLGIAYAHGHGIPDDLEKAIDYYKQAVAAGDWDAVSHMTEGNNTGENAELIDQAVAAGHRMVVLTKYLWNEGDDRAAALRQMIDATSRLPLYSQYDNGLRYMPNMSSESDYDLFYQILYARRSEWVPWSAEEFEQVLAPLKQRYDCVGGRLYLETTEILGCVRP